MWRYRSTCTLQASRSRSCVYEQMGLMCWMWNLGWLSNPSWRRDWFDGRGVVGVCKDGTPGVRVCEEGVAGKGGMAG